MEKNYYEILGIQKTATADELKSAYRKLAKKYHPDVYASASDAERKDAEEKFKEINHAYEILSDDQKRAAYDMYGDENGPQMNAEGFGFDVDDIFSSMFGSGFQSQRADAPQRGQDILASATISFEEAAFGIQRLIKIHRIENCPDCNGTGAKDGKAFKTCSQCRGSGRVVMTQRTPFGQVSSTTTCPSCKGTGRIITDKCTTCKGVGRSEEVKEVKINIPAGINTGQRVRYENEGNAGINGGQRGALYVEVQIDPHKLFVRNGADVHLEVPINFVDAILGCTIQVPTLYGDKEVKIPEGTQSGTVFTLKGCGIKKLKTSGKGDMFVKINVEVPKEINKNQKDLLNKFSESINKKQFPQCEAYKEKL